MVIESIDNIAVENYVDSSVRMLKKTFPNLHNQEIRRCVEMAVKNNYKDHTAKLVNNYTKKTSSILLSEMVNYIHEREPICCSSGVMFKKHGTVPNPLTKMIDLFIQNRKANKKKMFTYPKGSELFEMYNLLQLLDKIDTNGIYGVLGQYSSIFYNIFVAQSITMTGRSLISSATMFFESFLSNNVKFANLNEVIYFIDNVVNERKNRKFKDNEILSHQVSIEECFAKIVLTIGDFRKGIIKWLPDMEDLQIIWDILCELDQEDLNRLYYKNNLFEFMSNDSMKRAIVYIIDKLNEPFMDPNEPPEEIKVELDSLLDILREYVYYGYQYMDRTDRCDNMVKNVCIISDTDSAIVNLDAWYRFGLDVVKGHDFEINKIYSSPLVYFKDGENDYKPIYYTKDEDSMIEDYDFFNDEIIYRKRILTTPLEYTPCDNLRYTLINIMAYVIGNLVNEYMIDFTKRNHSYSDDKKCYINMKNEFLFRRLLLTNAKKNYASSMEIQEGNIIPDGKDLDIKGLPIKKSTLNPRIQHELEKILYEDILRAEPIDQVNIVKKLAILEKKIYHSLESGEKEFYKPLAIKSMDSYDDPMRIQGVKASLIWNRIKDEDLETIDLSARNSIDVVKVKISKETAEVIKDTYPETYDKIIDVLNDDTIFVTEFKNARKTNKDPKIIIDSLAIPKDVKTPEWVRHFIDYKTIIKDNLTNFPIESVGIVKMNSNANFTNIVNI